MPKISAGYVSATSHWGHGTMVFITTYWPPLFPMSCRTAESWSERHRRYCTAEFRVHGEFVSAIVGRDQAAACVHYQEHLLGGGDHGRAIFGQHLAGPHSDSKP